MLLLLTLSLVALSLAENPNKGLLIVGNWCNAVTTELWAPDDTQCMLANLTSDTTTTTVNVLQDKVLACYAKTCDQLTESGWEQTHDLLFERYFYTTIVTNEGMLLVGSTTETAELIPVNNGPNEPAFTLEWWEYTDGKICSVKIDNNSFVLTGGGRSHSARRTTLLSKLQSWKNVSIKELPQLNSGREGHACGSYWVNEHLILIVTGRVVQSRSEIYLKNHVASTSSVIHYFYLLPN